MGREGEGRGGEEEASDTNLHGCVVRAKGIKTISCGSEGDDMGMGRARRGQHFEQELDMRPNMFFNSIIYS